MRGLHHYFIFGVIPDISTADEVVIPCPDGGKCTKVYTALGAVIATADADITPKANGTAMTNGLITVAFSGSAIGDVDSSEPTAVNEVAPGGYFSIATDGASDNAVKLGFCLVIER